MRAVLCKAYGPPETLVVEDVPALKAGPGEVVVKVKAAGANFPDSLIIQNKYQFKPPLPFSPGGEFAGVVSSVGEGVDRVKVGQSVIGFAMWGAYAEEVKVAQKDLIPMPEGMPFDVAGSFLMTYGTSYHAFTDRAKLAPGETVLVLGAAGGIGISSIELAKALGAKVIAAASSDEKLETCRKHGADLTINYQTGDLRAQLKELAPKGVDVICDPVGGAYSEAALRGIAWRGRFLVVGFTAGEIPKIPLNLALLKGCSIVGVFWGDFLKREPHNSERELKELVALYRAGKIKPLVSGRYPLEKASDALYALMERKVQGKVVIVP
jgi:NADPH2:quinone reductase